MWSHISYRVTSHLSAELEFREISTSKTNSHLSPISSKPFIISTYDSKSATSWTSEWRVCLRDGAISSATPPHMASKCADTRESRKFSVPTSIKQDVFHEEAEGKFVSPMLFHFSRAFFTGDGRPKMESKYNETLVQSYSQGSCE